MFFLKDKNFFSHSESIQQDFDTIYSYCEEDVVIKNIDKYEFYDTYFRFRILVGSRIFGYIKYGIDTSGIVPYIDLINHSEIPNTIWYFDDSLDSFVLMSTKYIPKGKEICDNYGITNNIELLLYYGFTLESNPNPILSFDMGGTNYFFNLNLDMNKLNELGPDEKIKLKAKLKNISSPFTKDCTV